MSTLTTGDAVKIFHRDWGAGRPIVRWPRCSSVPAYAGKPQQHRRNTTFTGPTEGIVP